MAFVVIEGEGMNKTPRLSKSGIEYLDYMWGIFSGCQNLQKGVCSVKACWAKGLTSHFPKLYPRGFDPTYYPEAINSPMLLKKPSRIGVGWVGDVIGYGPNPRECLDLIAHKTKWCVLGNHDYAVFYEPTNFNFAAEQASWLPVYEWP